VQYGIPEIDVGTLLAWREAGQPVRLVDVRTGPEVSQGLIPGAHHVPLHLLPLRHRELEGDDALVLYCRSGARSAQAAMWLAGQGRAAGWSRRRGGWRSDVPALASRNPLSYKNHAQF